MRYEESLDCWVVVWDDETGYRMRCGEWFELYLGYGKVLSGKVHKWHDISEKCTTGAAL